jgi:hypothetical protein
MRESIPPVVLSFGQCLVEAHVSEILRLYIFLAFRMNVLDTDMNEVFVARGGMLGVSGINTAACVTFAAFWIAQCPLLAQEENLQSVSCYMGGDDFRLLLEGGTLGRHSAVWNRATARIRKYIGALSEEVLEPLLIDSAREGGIYLRARFCKKLTYFRWIHTATGVKLQGQSQFRIPLHRSFLKERIGIDGPEREKLEDFIADMRRNIPWIEEQSALIGTIYAVLNILHGPVPFTIRTMGDTHVSGVEVTDGMTMKAAEIVDQSDTPSSRSWGLVTSDRDSKIKWLLRCGRLRATQVRNLEWPQVVIHSASETSYFGSVPGDKRPLAPPKASSAAHVARILVCLVRVREAVTRFRLEV